MIRYAVQIDVIETAIETIEPNWLDTAKMVQAEVDASPGTKLRPIWREIKPALLMLQADKCGFCERYLGASRIHSDVEHYRPKAYVDGWPPVPGKAPEKRNPANGGSPNGYRAIVYSLMNLFVACKSCNTTFKGNYFPIAGTRDISITDATSLLAERPLLLHPLDVGDPDSAGELIRFVGPLPVPADTDPTSHAFRRADVTIQILGLDREELIVERCRLMVDLSISFESESELSTDRLRRAADPSEPHSNFARSYLDLCETDWDLAREFAKRAEKYVRSVHHRGAVTR